MAKEDAVVVGVDSGGTKTIACAVTLDGQIKGIGYGGPTNAIFVSESDAIYAMREAVAAALGVTSSEPDVVSEVQSIYLSSPGFSTDAAERALRDLCPEALLKVEGDAPAVFRAAIPSGDGIVALSGTGSFAAGIWRGKWLTNGGWGPLLGDEGSGYWIGLEALRAVALAAEQRGPETSLQSIFRRALRYSFDEELRRFVYRKNLNRQRIAGLTILVAQAAREGDAVAKSILTRAGQELSALAANLANRFQIGGAEVTVSLLGGVARNDATVVASFKEAVEHAIPGARYVAPRLEPWAGAVLLALEMLSQDASPVLISGMENIARQAASA
jgi:N-acetylglucosamine kinase-like BadF-type ATPase